MDCISPRTSFNPFVQIFLQKSSSEESHLNSILRAKCYSDPRQVTDANPGTIHALRCCRAGRRELLSHTQTRARFTPTKPVRQAGRQNLDFDQKIPIKYVARRQSKYANYNSLARNTQRCLQKNNLLQNPGRAQKMPRSEKTRNLAGHVSCCINVSREDRLVITDMARKEEDS